MLSSRWNRAVVSALACLIALCLIAAQPLCQVKAEPSSKLKSVPGWEDISDCSEFTSIDSKKSLSLSPDGSASLVDTDEAGKTKSYGGSWSLIDPAQRGYLVNVPGMISRYILVSPPDGSCLMVSGSVERADLRLSWFSVRVGPEDAPD